MPETVDIPLADLLFDTENPRLVGGFESQQEAALALAAKQKSAMVNLAADIVENGIDPLNLTAAVPTSDRRKRYRVIEGNRRLLALRALETPSLVNPVLSPSDSRRLAKLSARFEDNPVLTLRCVLFESDEDARHWIELRHTGQNNGVGLIEWGTDEKDRFTARHRGGRRPAGQVLDFVERFGHLSDQARNSQRRILTSIQRLLTTPDARQALGVDLQGGQVVALYPQEEVARSLTRVVEDFKSGRKAVPDIYRAEDRVRYVEDLPSSVLPKRSTKLSMPVLLNDLAAGDRAPRTQPATKPKPRRRKEPHPRTTVVPRDSRLDVTPPRINRIYNELTVMNAEELPNAASVLLRVFVELSVDHYVEANQLMTDADLRNQPLAKRMKTAAAHLHTRGKISPNLKAAVERVANGQSVIAPSVPTFNQYVHNQYVFPRPSELYASWDELAPFLEQLWA